MLRALRAPAVGYAWLLLGAVVVMILIVVAANVGSTGADTGIESDDTNAIGVLIGMPFQIAGMALLGSLHFTEDGIRASLFLPPLALTGLYLLMTARAARRCEAVPATGTRALLGAIVGLVVALVVTPLTWVLAMREDGAAVHTASISLFFGVWILTGLASYAGTSRAAGAGRPAWVPSDYASAARLWLGSVGVWLVASLVVLTVVAAVEVDLWMAILFPVWGVTAGLYTYALGHFGSLSFAGESTNIGDLGAGWAIALVVAALALAVLTSIAWHLRRDTREPALAQPGSWVVLPATYAVGGMLVWLVPSVVLSGGMGALGGSATLQPAFWLVFVLVVWGAVVELASRFLAPSLVTVLPPRVRALLRGPERVEAAPASATVAAETRPLTPEERARYQKIGIAAGVVAAVGILGWITVSIVNNQFYGPEDQAAAYLDALVDGDLDEANDLAPVDDDRADDSLLSSGIYSAAESRVTGYEIGDVTDQGDSVTMEVSLEGLDGSADAELVMEKDGHSSVLFDKWKVADGGLASVVTLAMPDGASDLSVNDEAVDPVDGDVWLLPGSYVFDAFAGNEWLESTGEPVVVAVDEDYQYADVPRATASAAFQEEVQSQIDTYLEACMASTDLEPENCPNAAYAYGDVRGVTWTLDEAPTADVEYFDGTFPADLSYGESGRATVSYEVDESYGYGPRDWQSETEETDLYLSSVTVTDEDGSLVVSISE
ncbi:MAG: hypothetical protein WBP61_12285 [Nocardioides sp.]